MPFVIFATIFFLAGGYFCWAVVFKIGYAFFLGQYASIGVTPTIRISEYLAFSAKLLIAFAITFEMPIFAFFLTRLGLVDYRMMIRYIPLRGLGDFRRGRRADAARHDFAVSARDSAAVAVRIEHRGLVLFPRAAAAATAAGSADVTQR